MAAAGAAVVVVTERCDPMRGHRLARMLVQGTGRADRRPVRGVDAAATTTGADGVGAARMQSARARDARSAENRVGGGRGDERWSRCTARCPPDRVVS
jgi:hypothetical protein